MTLTALQPTPTDRSGQERDDARLDASTAAPAPVTIVMSNYNQAQYLEESLSGLVDQTRPAARILVIDDGSSDNSVDIIRQYAREHANLRLIRNKVNLGLQDSIARILPLVTTDYLVWAASDDKLLPDFLERSMRELENHPEAGLCFSELTVLVDETGEIQPFAREPSVSHIFDLSDLPRYMPPAAVEARMKRSYFPVSGNTVVAHRERLAACGNFFKELQWHSDHFAFNVLALRYGACVVPATLGLIRQRADSYSASGMHSPDTQRPVLEAMLDILARDDFSDVRAAFERAPSFYSVWGTTILRLMLRRGEFWPTAARYTAWKYKQYRLGYKLSHRQALSRLARRAIRIKIPKGFSMDLFGRKQRALQGEVETLRSERDGLISERDRLGQAVQETAEQRDSANAEVSRAKAEIESFSAELREARRDIRKLRRDLSYVQTDLKESRNRLDSVLSERDTIRAELEKKESEIRKLADEMDNLRSETEKKLDGVRSKLAEKTELLQAAIEERDAINAQLADRADKLRTATDERDAARLESLRTQEALLRREAHTGPRDEGFFTPDSVIYDDAEVRPEHMIPITTLPKSGTYYLARMFSEGLGLRPLVVSNQYFPHDTIYQPRLREFVKGGYVSQDHFPASPINVAHLAHLIERIVVQVRDPRQAMLSYVHFLNIGPFTDNKPETRRFVYPTLPEDFYERDLAKQLDWGIEHWLPELVQWIDGWIEADRSSTLSVLFTRFEDLVTDEAALARSVLEFLEIPPEDFSHPDIELDSSVHFRKGLREEWRDILNPDQVARANTLIPEHMMARFEWPE